MINARNYLVDMIHKEEVKFNFISTKLVVHPIYHRMLKQEALNPDTFDSITTLFGKSYLVEDMCGMFRLYDKKGHSRPYNWRHYFKSGGKDYIKNDRQKS